MFSIICSFFLPAVAQNADACAFWKLTFNRDFRSTEFQEIKINSCPAPAASWGQCLLRECSEPQRFSGGGAPGASQAVPPCPTNHFWAGKWNPLLLFPSLSNFPSCSRVFTNVIFTVLTHKGALNSLWALFGSHTSAPNIPPHLPHQSRTAAMRRI